MVIYLPAANHVGEDVQMLLDIILQPPLPVDGKLDPSLLATQRADGCRPIIMGALDPFLAVL